MMFGPDLLLTVANLLLLSSVIPTLLNDDAAIPRWQSAITAVGLGMVTVANAMLGAHLGATATLLATIAWVFIFAYRNT